MKHSLHLLFFFFVILQPFSAVQAMPAGSPAYPVTPAIEPGKPGSCSLQLCSGRDIFNALSGSLKMGFSGDYIFSESARVNNVPVKVTPSNAVTNMNFNLNEAKVGASCAFLSLSMQDMSYAAFPILDISLDIKCGGLKEYLSLPLNAFRNYTSSPVTASTPGVVDKGLLSMQTNYGLAWELSVKKVLWKDGLTFIGCGVGYRRADCSINYMMVNDQTNADITFHNARGKVNHKEWSANLGLTTYINDYILPYLAVTIGNTLRKIPQECLTQAEALLTSNSATKLQTRTITNFHRANLCCGATAMVAENFFYHVEGRWGYQRAFNINGGFNF